MPLDLPEDLKTDLVVCGISGKRCTGVRELHDLLAPLVLKGQVALVPKDGLCSPEALNRYVKWAKATFFIRVEAPDEVRSANNFRAQFGPEDHVRDEHWTETALDDWDGWDAVVHNDGKEDTLLAHANELAPRINALVASPELSKHRPVPDELLPKREHTSAMPECMVPGWGVNPPRKNEHGEYQFQAGGQKPWDTGTGEPQVPQAARAEQESAPKNTALQAAMARAAVSSARWQPGENAVRDVDVPPSAEADGSAAAASSYTGSPARGAKQEWSPAKPEWGSWDAWGSGGASGSGQWENWEGRSSWGGAWGGYGGQYSGRSWYEGRDGQPSAGEQFAKKAELWEDPEGADASTTGFGGGQWSGAWSSGQGSWRGSWSGWS